MPSSETQSFSLPDNYRPMEPYIAKVPGKLYMIGLAHLNDHRIQATDIARNAWLDAQADFEQRKAADKATRGMTVLTEGQLRLGDVMRLETPEAALREEGDPGLHTWYAYQCQAEVVSGEPETTWIDNILIDEFGPRPTALATYIRFAAQYLRGKIVGTIGPEVSYDNYVNGRDRFRESLRNERLAPWLEKETLNSIWEELYPDCGPLDPAMRVRLADGETRGSWFYTMLNNVASPDGRRIQGPLVDLVERFLMLRDVHLNQKVGELHRRQFYPVVTFSNYHAAILHEAALSQVGASKEDPGVVLLAGKAACQQYYDLPRTS